MPATLRKVAPGDPPRAEDINQLIDAVKAAMEIRGGPGIAVQKNGLATVIALAAAFGEVFVPAIITQAVGALPDDLPANVKYKAKPIGYSGGETTLRVPDMGRSIQGARVVRANQGDLCFIGRTKAGGKTISKLWVITEMTPSHVCTGGAAANAVGDDHDCGCGGKGKDGGAAGRQGGSAEEDCGCGGKGKGGGAEGRQGGSEGALNAAMVNAVAETVIAELVARGLVRSNA